MTKDKINNLRDKIDDLDNKILSLLDERSLIVNEIGEVKDKTVSVIDKSREQSVINRLLNNLKGSYSKDTIVRIWRELFYASSKLQIATKSKILAKRGIEDIKVYTGGKSNIKGQKKIIKLSSNENALEPSANVYEILAKIKSLHRYGEINGQSLRSQLSKIHSIEEDQIVLGNGSGEILLMSALSFCHPGDEIIHSQHGFEMYPIISKLVGAVSVFAEENNYKLNIYSILKKITTSTKVIFIDNPNNPSGTFVDKKDLYELLSRVPSNVIVIIDGAYAEYVENENYDSGFNLIKKFENLIITRTFSKVYGLAGIRLGWCYTSKRIATILNKVKPPFNVNSVALEIASVALEDVQHLNGVVNENKRNREWFENELKKLNIQYLPSASNFIFLECDPNSNMAEKIFNLLLENGIIVRQLNSYGLPHCLRITIGKRQEMEKTIDVLSKGNFS